MSKSFRDRQSYFLRHQQDVNKIYLRKSNPEAYLAPNDLPEDVKNRTHRNSITHTFILLGKGNAVPNLRNSEAQLKLRLRRNERAKSKNTHQKMVANN